MANIIEIGAPTPSTGSGEEAEASVRDARPEQPAVTHTILPGMSIYRMKIGSIDCYNSLINARTLLSTSKEMANLLNNSISSFECYNLTNHNLTKLIDRHFPIASGDGCAFKFQLKKHNGDVSDLFFKIYCNRKDKLIMTIVANSSELYNVNNIPKVIKQEDSFHLEKPQYLMTPFLFLREIFQLANEDFEWTAVTAQGIKDLDFGIWSRKLWTYLPIEPYSCPKLLSILRCFYNASFRHADGAVRTVADALGIEMRCRLKWGRVDALIFKFRKSGRLVLELCLSDQYSSIAHKRKTLGLEADKSDSATFRRTHLHAQITLHEEAGRDILREARIVVGEKERVSAAMYGEAVARLDRREGRSQLPFVSWLLEDIFEKKLRLWLLLNFRPALLEEVQGKLNSFVPAAGEGFKEYINLTEDEKQGCSSFAQYLIRRGKIARSSSAYKATAISIELGYDPNILLRVYEAVFGLSPILLMNDIDCHELMMAVERHDDETTGKMLRKARESAIDVVRDVMPILRNLINGAHVPAREINQSIWEDWDPAEAMVK